MPPDEGLALHDAAVDATAGARRAVPRDRQLLRQVGGLPRLGRGRRRHRAVRRRSPSRLGGEPAGVGVARARSRRPAVGRIDTLPTFRRTVLDAGLEPSVVAVVGDSPTVGAWTTPLALLFIDGGHGPSRPTATTSCGRRTWPRAACSPSTTCSPTRPTVAARRTRSTAGRSSRAVRRAVGDGVAPGAVAARPGPA